MGFKDIMDKLSQRSSNRKELIRDLDEQVRMQRIVEDRQKSSNERELEKFMKEGREESIKVQLEQLRKIRENDIRFNHNPLDTPNITNHTDWEILKERNMFTNNKNIFSKNKNIFSNQRFIHQNNPKLLKSEMKLMQ